MAGIFGNGGANKSPITHKIPDKGNDATVQDLESIRKLRATNGINAGDTVELAYENKVPTQTIGDVLEDRHNGILPPKDGSPDLAPHNAASESNDATPYRNPDDVLKISVDRIVHRLTVNFTGVVDTVKLITVDRYSTVVKFNSKTEPRVIQAIAEYIDDKIPNLRARVSDEYLHQLGLFYHGSGTLQVEMPINVNLFEIIIEEFKVIGDKGHGRLHRYNYDDTLARGNCLSAGTQGGPACQR
jgi:hypothetical protein